MPLDSTNPPGPILQEFDTLTGMSSEGIHHKLFVPAHDSRSPRQRGRPKGVKNPFKGVKIEVQSLGFASVGAGAILKMLRNSKIVGMGRSCSDSSSSDVVC
nr:reverse transcriptase zinc-binding domain-containing protein [Tanacetum cinerariifolium]